MGQRQGVLSKLVSLPAKQYELSMLRNQRKKAEHDLQVLKESITKMSSLHEQNQELAKAKLEELEILRKQHEIAVEKQIDEYKKIGEELDKADKKKV
mmetsp:Transcript_18996/g.31067  ORF Transcript_18996/g.31067 Transcript_18996/m.31067 type:complete len:97 (-) Transcript_18996:735-1025(-)